MLIRYKSGAFNNFMRTISYLAALSVLLVLVIILVSPSYSFLTALQGEERVRIIILSIALAAMLAIGIPPRTILLKYLERFAVIDEARSVYPPIYTRDCVLRC